MPDASQVLTGLALASGLTGAVVAIWKVGPERTNVIVTYQTEVLDNLRKENQRLLGVNAELLDRVARLERKAWDEERKRLDVERRLELLEGAAPPIEERGTRKDDPKEPQ